LGAPGWPVVGVTSANAGAVVNAAIAAAHAVANVIRRMSFMGNASYL
jgi:hypothetical protein